MVSQGKTQPPHRLTERDLIEKMERYGIGTDATVAEHIQKQIDRGYTSVLSVMDRKRRMSCTDML